jgi:hypothetical protein
MKKLAMTLLLGALYGSAALALDDTVTVTLDAQNASGQNGSATLTPQGDATRVVILLGNAPQGIAQPAHIHLGQCDRLEAAPKWKLEPVKDGQSTTVIPVPLDRILRDKAAINVHKSAAEVQVYVSCGNIVPVM